MKKKFAVLAVLFTAMFLMISACEYIEEALDIAGEADKLLSEGEDLTAELKELSADEDRYSHNTGDAHACSILPKDLDTAVISLVLEILGKGENVEMCSTEDLIGKCEWGKDKIYTYFYEGSTVVAAKATCKTAMGGTWTYQEDAK